MYSFMCLSTIKSASFVLTFILICELIIMAVALFVNYLSDLDSAMVLLTPHGLQLTPLYSTIGLLT